MDCVSLRYIKESVYKPTGALRFRVRFMRDDHIIDRVFRTVEDAVSFRDKTLLNMGEAPSATHMKPKFNITDDTSKSRFSIRYLVEGKSKNERFPYTSDTKDCVLRKAESRQQELRQSLWNK